MKLTEQMQKVVAIANEFASAVTYSENEVHMTFECRCLTSRNTSAVVKVAYLRVDCHKRQCVLTLNEVTESIHWFTHALVEYRDALGVVVEACNRLWALNYTKS